jgi:hypothetical protein
MAHATNMVGIDADVEVDLLHQTEKLGSDDSNGTIRVRIQSR